MIYLIKIQWLEKPLVNQEIPIQQVVDPTTIEPFRRSQRERIPAIQND